jgi:hypothetical protein
MIVLLRLIQEGMQAGNPSNIQGISKALSQIQ